MEVLCGKVSRAVGLLKYAKKFVPKDALMQCTRALSSHTFATVAQGEAVMKQDCKLCKDLRIELQGSSRMAAMIHMRQFSLTLSDLGGGGIPPSPYIFIYTFFLVCWMPLRFSKFNFLSYSNETVTSLVFYF